MWLLLLYVIVIIFMVTFLTRKLTGSRKRVSLKNKSIFITGCDSGFGFSLALHCSGLGMKVVAGCYDATGEGRHQLETLDNVRVVSLDVRDNGSVEAAVEVDLSPILSHHHKVIDTQLTLQTIKCLN